MNDAAWSGLIFAALDQWNMDAIRALVRMWGEQSAADKRNQMFHD